MIFFINVHNFNHVLSGAYFCPNSIKIKSYTVSTKNVTKKEKLVILNLAESSEVKSLAFPVVLLRTSKTSR